MRIILVIFVVSVVLGGITHFYTDYNLSYPYFVWMLFLMMLIAGGFLMGNDKSKGEESSIIVSTDTPLEKNDVVQGLNEYGVSYIPFSCSSGYYLYNQKTKDLRIEVIQKINVFMQEHPEYRIINLEHVCNDRGWLEEIGVWVIRTDDQIMVNPDVINKIQS